MRKRIVTTLATLLVGVALLLALTYTSHTHTDYSFTSWQSQLQYSTNPCKAKHIDSINDTLCWAGYGIWVNCEQYHDDRACRELDN